MTEYDSARDTIQHAHRVHFYCKSIIRKIMESVAWHDVSKLFEPEKSAFDEVTPLLKTLTYGTPEYEKSLEALGPALKSHYENNRHHPEHFEDGISGMTLMDLVEMLADWKAASERHASGDVVTSLQLNIKRFGIEPQLADILGNTIRAMEWDREPAAE